MMSPTEILQHYWGYDSFRPMQEDVVHAVLSGQDTLVLMPTGGGKSLCFQVPALAQAGICIVVTPLIALMKDQVEALRRRGIPASAVFSGMHWREIDTTLDNCIYGNTKFLYVSPERLQTEIMIERAKQMTVCLLAVDEAHCISAWGYDFRPPYLQIAEFRTFLPASTPVIALTASATPAVQTDIIERLQLRPGPGKQPVVFRQSFARPNLSYSVFRDDNKEARLLRVLTNVPGCGIVYVRSRRQTEQIAAWLTRQGIPADFYHAGLSTQQRADRQDAWLTDKTRIIVATNAFGMGIDKPGVRAVVHLDVPESLEAYYQEAGRAGRDGERAYAVLLGTTGDLETMEFKQAQQFPSVALLRQVYQAVANYLAVPVGSGQFVSYDFDLQTLISTFNLPPQETHFALKELQHQGFLELSEGYFRPSRLKMAVDHRQLYEFQVMNSRYDSFLKLVLRIYGGELFTDFLAIAESQIARAFLVNQTEVVALLKQLHERNILTYEPQKDKPQLTLLTPRLDAPTLTVDVMALNQRRERAKANLKAIADYVQNTTQCRTRIIQGYFGEAPSDACGICDTCLKNKPRPDPTEALSDQLRAYLTQANGTGVSPRQLADAFARTNADALANAVRQMLDSGELQYNEGGNLVLNEIQD